MEHILYSLEVFGIYGARVFCSECVINTTAWIYNKRK